jgi:hypothetical protein
VVLFCVVNNAVVAWIKLASGALHEEKTAVFEHGELFERDRSLVVSRCHPLYPIITNGSGPITYQKVPEPLLSFSVKTDSSCRSKEAPFDLQLQFSTKRS